MIHEIAISSSLPPRPAPRFALRRRVADVARPLIERAARAYVAGDSLADALAVQTTLAGAGRYATLGYWNHGDEDPQGVLAHYQAALAALAENRFAGTCSIKLPALDFRADLLAELATAALRSLTPVHCDSHSVEDAERTFQVVERWRAEGLFAGVTLPGRWRRSLDDARWVAARALSPRVVKGQWADPADPDRDPRRGFLEVIDALAGAGIRRVAVATHDVPLATAAIQRLQSAGVGVTLELLYGLPLRPALSLAKRLEIDVRLYVPYGTSYLPYALSKILGHPQIAWRLLRDLLVGALTPEHRIV